MKMVKRVITIIYKAIKWVFVLLVVYLASAILFAYIPVNRSFKESEEGIDIFVKSNGVHTDIIVPARSALFDWRKKLPGLRKYDKDVIKYIAFGWGDKGFYLYTPTWADLKATTALKAAFWLGTSAMHVTYYPERPALNDHTGVVRISKEQYKALVDYIDHSFRTNEEKEYEEIDCCHYTGLDNEFYEGRGVYSLLKTCNTWTNKGLKETGVKTAFWAPFEWSVMRYRVKE